MPNTQLWIEPLGHVIVARLRGELSESMLEETHKRVVQLLQDTGHTRVLYDGLEIESPNVGVCQRSCRVTLRNLL